MKESHNVMVGSTSETIGNYSDQEGESRNSEAVEINTPKKKRKKTKLLSVELNNEVASLPTIQCKCDDIRDTFFFIN